MGRLEICISGSRLSCQIIEITRLVESFESLQNEFWDEFFIDFPKVSHDADRLNNDHSCIDHHLEIITSWDHYSGYFKVFENMS